jgi:hypothetical protein
VKTFAFDIRVEVEARDEEQARDIAEQARLTLENPSFPWRLKLVDIDNLEEV